MLVMCFVVYTAASLLHFAHNAAFVDAYPNLPSWITAAVVYQTWMAQLAIGLFGTGLVRAGWKKTGLAIVAIYGALGLDGFAHYALAPMAAHAGVMNFTIWFEAIAGTTLALACAKAAVANPA